MSLELIDGDEGTLKISEKDDESDEEDVLQFDEEEDDNSTVQINKSKPKTINNNSSSARRSVTTSSFLDDLDSILDEPAKPIEDWQLYQAAASVGEVKSKSTRRESDVTNNNPVEEENTGTPNKQSKTKKSTKPSKDVADAIYAQYKRSKEVNEDDLPQRSLKHVVDFYSTVEKSLNHLNPLVDVVKCRTRPLKVTIAEVVNDNSEKIEHALEDDSSDSSEEEDFELVVTNTSSIKPIEEKKKENNTENMEEEDEEDELFEPSNEDSSDSETEETNEENETTEPESLTEEENKTVTNNETIIKEIMEEVNKDTAPSINDTFNDPLIGQTVTQSVIEENEENNSNEEEEDIVEKERLKKEKEMLHQARIKQFVKDLKDEEQNALYLSDECEEEDEEGNIVIRKFEEAEHLDEKELEKEIADFIELYEEDIDEYPPTLNQTREEEEEADFSEEEDETISIAGSELNDDNLPSIKRKPKVVLTPESIKQKLRQNKEVLRTVKRQDGGYGKFSSRGSQLLNLTLSQITSASQSLENEDITMQDRREVEARMKETERKHTEAYKKALKKRKRELEKQNQDVASVSISSSLTSESQDLLSLIQSSQEIQETKQKSNKPKSFLGKGQVNQKAKQFAAKLEKNKQEKAKTTLLSKSTTPKETPTKKRKTTDKKKKTSMKKK
ncbi:hypothetical protein ABK040_010362 [Willaertia magna]